MGEGRGGGVWLGLHRTQVSEGELKTLTYALHGRTVFRMCTCSFHALAHMTDFFEVIMKVI